MWCTGGIHSPRAHRVHGGEIVLGTNKRVGRDQITKPATSFLGARFIDGLGMFIKRPGSDCVWYVLALDAKE